MTPKTWTVITIALVAGLVISSSSAFYYYQLSSDMLSRFKGRSVTVDLAVNYGDGRAIEWHNGTRLTGGSTLYDVMLESGLKVEGKPYGTMGLFITSINDVSNSDSEGKYWVWWIRISSGWIQGPTAADKYVLGDGEVVMWYRSGYNTTSNMPTPPP